MGKWTELVKGLPRLPIEGGDTYQERVDAAKFEFLGSSSVLAQRYRELRDERDTLEATRSALDLRLRALEQLLVSSFEAEGLESLRLAGGAAVRTEPEPYAQVEDADAVRSWAAQNGMQGKMSLPWQTLQAEVKSLMLDGQPEPPGVKLYFRTKVVLSR